MASKQGDASRKDDEKKDDPLDEIRKMTNNKNLTPILLSFKMPGSTDEEEAEQQEYPKIVTQFGSIGGKKVIYFYILGTAHGLVVRLDSTSLPSNTMLQFGACP